MSRRSMVFSAALVFGAVSPVCAQTAGLDRLPSRFAEYRGARIHYKSTGTGTTGVVFVHGFAGALEVWEAQLPAVEGRTRALFVDLPGSGRSDKPNVAYTMDYLAGGIDAVVRDAGVERVVLVGHSLGTPVVRQYYRRYPSKVVGLVAVDGALRSFLRDSAQVRTFAARFEGSDYAKNVGEMFDGMLATMTDTAMRALIKRIAVATPKHSAASAMREQFDPAIWRDDPITVPVLAVMAPNPGWNDDYVAYVKRLAPGIRYEVIPRSGHFVMVEHAGEFNALLSAFLSAERIVINDNRVPSGALSGNVLAVRLEAREGQWHPDEDNGGAITVRAFAESGRPPSIPGPLMRVVEGTEIQASIRNTLSVPLIMRLGEHYRLRIIDIHTARPSMIARMLRDSTPVAWRAVAKDGMPLPPDQATMRPAVQQMGNGETYDFELVPTAVGELRFTVSSAAGALLVSQTFRVR